jgi:hypothetical protein
MKGKIPGILLGLLAPIIASAAKLDIPAQPLGASLEALSKQLDVRILFDPKLVVLNDAPPLKGEFSPEHALDTLLAQTDLTYHVKDLKTIEIAVSVDEVIVRGRSQQLSQMRKEYEELEDQFYDEYNKLNTDHQWDVSCEREAPTGSRFERRVCTPTFVKSIEHDYFVNGHHASVWNWVQPKREAFKKNMADSVNRNPKLLELLMKRKAVEQRYEELRKKKFSGGKVFVPD